MLVKSYCFLLLFSAAASIQPFKRTMWPYIDTRSNLQLQIFYDLISFSFTIISETLCSSSLDTTQLGKRILYNPKYHVTTCIIEEFSSSRIIFFCGCFFVFPILSFSPKHLVVLFSME